MRAGLLSVQLQSWFVPAGAITFGAAEFPRSQAEAMSRFGT